MEITKSNFESLLPFIRSTLLESDFISIDCELTGLHSPEIQLTMGDTPSQRYNKLKTCVEEFSVIQYGVCGFKYESDRFIASPFNFYVYATSSNVVQVERLISFSADSVKFLRENQFDFNKLIDDGIPYYSFSEENVMLPSKGTLKAAEWHPINETLLPAKNKKFLKHKRQEIQRWLLNEKQSHVLQVNNIDQKRLIFQEIQDPCYENQIQATVRDSKHLLLLKTKVIQAQQRVLKEHENFRTVIEIIQEAACPVIGHNASFDLLHTVHHFWQRLPVKLSDFKLIRMWNTFVDTKYLAEMHPELKDFCKSHNLGNLYNAAVKQVGQQVVMADGFNRYVSEIKHEAGYDAYMTGVVYIGLINCLKDESIDVGSKRKRVDAFNTALFMDQSITAYYNKLYMGKEVCIHLKDREKE